MRFALFPAISFLIVSTPIQAQAKIKDIVAFEFDDFLRFAIEFSEKTDFSFSADGNRIEISFSKNIGHGKKRTKKCNITWSGKRLQMNFATEFSYARYFLMPFPYKLIVDVGFSKRDVQDIISAGERKGDKHVVVVDPGHGGKDPGTVWKKIREKDLVKEMADILYDKLKNAGFVTILTRNRDVFLELEERSAIANAAECDVFLSIHVNSTHKRVSPSGFELFYFSQRFSEHALRVAQKENGVKLDQNYRILFDIYSEIREEESRRLAKSIAGRLRRMKSVRTIEGAPLYVLAGTFCPAVLIELGFIENERDRTDLLSRAFMRKVADEILEGILDFLKEKDQKP